MGETPQAATEPQPETLSDDDAIIGNLIAEVRELRSKLEASRRVGITLAEVLKQQIKTLNEYDGIPNDDD